MKQAIVILCDGRAFTEMSIRRMCELTASQTGCNLTDITAAVLNHDDICKLAVKKTMSEIPVIKVSIKEQEAIVHAVNYLMTILTDNGEDNDENDIIYRLGYHITHYKISKDLHDPRTVDENLVKAIQIIGEIKNDDDAFGIYKNQIISHGHDVRFAVRFKRMCKRIFEN